MISFVWWNLIPIGLTIISFIFNIIQYVNKKSVFKPIKNSLIGFFNDVKVKNIVCGLKQSTLWNPNNPHHEVYTLKWDFNDFIISMNQAYYGLQEHIVALLKTLEVSDKEVFKAVDFGLTEKEKKMKDEWYKKFIEKLNENQKKTKKPKNLRIEEEGKNNLKQK